MVVGSIMEINFNWNDITDKTSLKLEPHQVEAIKRYQNRFAIPKGLTKKELKELLKNTQTKIDECLTRMRTLGPGDNILADIEREDYVDKKKRIKKILELHNDFGTEVNITKAKAYPIENLIDFNSAGFASCLWHEERTPSLKWYPQRNKAHCFAGCGDFDSIDAYQQINNVDFIKAVKALS